MKKLLMGNEAIARGAVEAGISVAACYPGTPSSEIFMVLSEMASKYNFYAEYSVNEKAALEVTAGAAYAGARAIVSMKQVGLNVAADPLMTLAYIGVKGGLVIVVADDPGPHSSQNEQDTRKFAQFAKIPVLNPGTPQEALEMTKIAFEISEKLEVPIIIRPTTRTCHVCQDVKFGEILKKNNTEFKKNSRWMIMPRLAYLKHKELNLKQKSAADFFELLSFNKVEKRDDIGIVTSGVTYNYVKEAVNIIGERENKLSILNISTFPVPQKMINKFLKNMEKIIVIEEQEPVLEDEIIKIAWKNKLSVEVSGKQDDYVPKEGELDTDKIKKIILNFLNKSYQEEETIMPELPVRPPNLCAGCPHRASFYAFKKATKSKDVVFTGDIGCYTLGNAAPLKVLDTCLCMGAGVTIAQGIKRVDADKRLVAFIGDSTFFHTGIPGLINAVYNQTNITLVILDNRTTAMTGFQPHPGLQNTAMGINEHDIDIEKIAVGCGVKNIYKVDPYDIKQAKKIAEKSIEENNPSVVIMERECAAISKTTKRFTIDNEKCTNCGLCYKTLGCPAIYLDNGNVYIADTCKGCSVCSQICPSGAIVEVKY